MALLHSVLVCVLPDTAIKDSYTGFLSLTSKAKIISKENKHPVAVVVVE